MFEKHQFDLKSRSSGKPMLSHINLLSILKLFSKKKKNKSESYNKYIL